ncbi:MAG TPA: LptF/LptG family permease [Pyrinomonadaceae bacterium]|nr:LptF/LptG family permease [Pyrinomonadaceae bacterium]
MKTRGWRLIERYIVKAILPYVGLSLLLLTFVLLAQQAGKFIEILGSADPTLDAVADIALGLIPNILIFTLPMSVLIGTATGLSRLGSDSELIVMRAAGVGTWRLMSPVLLLGVIFTLLTLYVGFEVAPRATTLMREAVIRVTLSKIESPIQPHTFNTEMPGKVVYVREGDKKLGRWGRVFIHWQDGKDLRLITARSGRLDITGEQTELVLTDAVVTTLPSLQGALNVNSTQVVTESSAQFRIRLNTGRNALLKSFQERRPEIEELHWRELLDRVRTTPDIAEKRALLIALNKRLAICCAPLAFALLGAGLGGRTKRFGRGQAVLISLGAMLLYYLVLLGGEHLSRNGTLAPQLGSWVATGLASLAGLLLLFASGRSSTVWGRRLVQTSTKPEAERSFVKRARRSILLGLLDRSLIRAICLNFALAYTMLLSIFLIFTLFELLRFITSTEWLLVVLYLLYLVPLASMSLAPIGLLVSVLITYALMARRSEVVVWWASGQSLYRLSMPALIFALFISAMLGVLQEKILPQANRKQEGYRAQIRGGLNRATTQTGFQWLAIPESKRLYTYRYEAGRQALLNPAVFEFDSEGVHLTRLIMAREGEWQNSGEMGFQEAEVVGVGRRDQPGSITRLPRYSLAENIAAESFKPMLNKPSELSSRALSNYIRALKKVKPEEMASLYVALYRRFADISTPLILALIGVPFGVFFGRRSAFWALGAAIVIGLALWASASGFQQLGNYRLLPAALAAWATPLIFTALGLILFSRART